MSMNFYAIQGLTIELKAILSDLMRDEKYYFSLFSWLSSITWSSPYCKPLVYSYWLFGVKLNYSLKQHFLCYYVCYWRICRKSILRNICWLLPAYLHCVFVISPPKCYFVCSDVFDVQIRHYVKRTQNGRDPCHIVTYLRNVFVNVTFKLQSYYDLFT